jgi:hypothetical protein
MERSLEVMKEIAFQFNGDLTAKVFGVVIDAQSIVEDYKWMIGKIEKYEKALKFYADDENHKRTYHDIEVGYPSNYQYDAGKKAKEALE